MRLTSALDLPPGVGKEGFLQASSGCVLAQTDLIATYERAP